MKCCRKSIFVLVLAVAGTGCVEPPPLETDTGSQAIAKGALNTTADYAVHIVGPESQCTGVLVTPRWVLTANHCITGVAAAPFSTVEADWIAEDLDIFIVPNGFSDDDDGTMIMHTNISSGNVIVNKTTAMDLGPGDGYDDAARDLALIRLDSPVPPSVALPLHPPILGVGSCDQQNEFDGLIVGFADTDDRSSKMVDDWERDDSPSTGDVYLTDWMLPIPFAVDPATVTTGVLAGFVGPGSIYTGIEGGDSGGPLVQGDRLCGVASGIEIYGTFSGPWCGPLWMCATIGNIFAAVDSPEATTFLSNNIVVNDTHGTPVFEGECSVGLAADSDGDGVWDGCDPFPFCETNNDADKDGVCDEVDNCLGVPNGLNNDSDGDGFGDACDPCPNDSPSPGIAQDEVGDHDSDGICDSVDNCFSIPNFEQKNSNLAWEEIHTPNDKRGDACEPVPQPAIDVITVDVVMGSADSPGGIETHDITRDTFDLKAHASHGPGFGILQTSINIPFVNPSNPFCAGPCVGFTEFRFCQPGENGPPFCDDVAALDEAQLHPEYASADDEMATDPWHRITLDFGAGPTTRGATLGIDYDDTVTQATWLYDVDADYWISSGAVSVPNHADFSAGKKGTDLDGYLWAHVTTGVGSWQDVGTGLHGSHLANAMEPIDVREQYTIVGDTTMPQYWWEEMLLTWIPRWPERIVDRFMFDRGLVTMTAMQDGGLVSQQAQTAMSSALVWSWPSSALDRVDQQSPIAIGVEDNGAIGEALFASAGGEMLMTSQELKIELDRSAPPSALQESRAVYSRQLKTLFVVGHLLKGRNSEVWARGVAVGSKWRQLASDAEIGEVLAMTIEAETRSLVIADRSSSEVRLLTIGVDSGKTSVARRVESGGGDMIVALTSGPNRSVVLTTSDGNGFAAMTFEIGPDGLFPSRLIIGEETLAHPLIDTKDGLVGAVGKDAEAAIKVFVPREQASWKDLDALFQR